VDEDGFRFGPACEGDGVSIQQEWRRLSLISKRHVKVVVVVVLMIIEERAGAGLR